ncbi:MAG: metallophosphoesterase [Desulfomonilaceae bacterium]|nr:metallophosphoesterase [Desulfomonilaceae bacterium]
MQEPAHNSEVRIVHLSDLHFGTVLPKLIEPLVGLIIELCPRVLVVSGDLTQRAKSSQFAAAAAFMKRIPVSKVVVPGNHDIKLWNVIRRFVDPLTNYRRYFGEKVEPMYQDNDIVVIGVNTARSLTWKGGRISYVQMNRLSSRLVEVPANVFKVVVMHHPIIPLSQGTVIPAVGRSRKARDILESVRTDVIMAGHAHHRHACRTERQLETSEHSILVIQAGTALSRRNRGMPNSFNVVDVKGEAVTVTPYEWLETRSDFKAVSSIRFAKRGIWEQATEEPECQADN